MGNVVSALSVLFFKSENIMKALNILLLIMTIIFFLVIVIVSLEFNLVTMSYITKPFLVGFVIGFVLVAIFIKLKKK